MAEIERKGAIRHQEGNIAGKEIKSSIASKLEKRERDAYKKVLGIEPEIKPLPEYVTSEVIKNLGKLGMELRSMPKLNLGTLDELKAVGEKEFLKGLERRYPNWRRCEGLSGMEKKDHSISRNLKEWYWERVKNGEVDFPRSGDYWVAVETMRKPSYGEKYKYSFVNLLLREYDRFDAPWDFVVNRIDENRKELLTRTDLPLRSHVGLLEPLEYNLLANREGWGKTDTYEWTETKHRDPDNSKVLIVGSSDNGGAAGVDWSSPHNSRRIGFRLAVVLGS